MHPVTVFIERFRAAVSVLILLSCSSRIVFMQMCILLYYWANKMMMMKWRKYVHGVANSRIEDG